MNDIIEKIYKCNLGAIQAYEIMDLSTKMQDYKKMLIGLNNCMGFLQESIKFCAEQEEYFAEHNFLSLLQEFIEKLIEIYQNYDYLLLVHYIKNNIIKIIMEMQIFIRKQENDSLELNKPFYYSNSGIKCFRYTNSHKNVSMSSKNSPSNEAIDLVNSWYDGEKSKYIIYGTGIICHLWYLANMDEGLEIKVYEAESQMMKSVEANGIYDLNTVLSKVEIYYDPTLIKLEKELEDFDNDTKFLIYLPSLNYISNQDTYAKIIHLKEKYCKDSMILNKSILLKKSILAAKDPNTLFLNNIAILDDSYRIVRLCHIQRYQLAFQLVQSSYNDIFHVFTYLIDNINFFHFVFKITTVELLEQIRTNIKAIYEKEDYAELADYYELYVIPLFKEIQVSLTDFIDLYTGDAYLKDNLALLYKKSSTLYNILKSHTIDESRYMLEYSEIGVVCLSIKLQSGYDFHLTPLENPFENGRFMASRYYQKETNHYIIYGFGMGYHLIEMAQMYTDAVIDIYESDISVLKIALQYADLKKILSKTNINIYYDPDFKKLNKVLYKTKKNSRTQFIIFNPSIMNIKSLTMKQLIEKIYIQDNTIRKELPKLVHNFKVNINNYKDSVDSVRKYFENKMLFIVAAGPSLDINIHLLKEIDRNNCVILCVGTVLKKLLNLGISPDFFIVSDPSINVYRQIEGIENCSIPMLFISTALREFSLNYKGDKYIILQNGFDLAENFAKINGYTLYDTGGSVSTVALEIGIRFGCKKIAFLGLDLAYTNNFAHASDTSQRSMESVDSMTLIKSVHGETISASKAFIWFREWIEERIRKCNDIEFIDATEGGAYIKGTRICKLSEILKEGY